MTRPMLLAMACLLPSLLAAQTATVPSRLNVSPAVSTPAAPASSRAVATSRVATSLPASVPTSRASSDKQVQYYVLLLNAKKVGYLVHKRQVEGEKVTTTEMLEITMSRSKTPVTITEKDICVESSDGTPLSFQTFQSLGGATQQVEGTVEGGKIRLLLNSGTAQTRQEMPWPQGAMMPEGLRLLQLSKGLAEGTSYAVRSFLPSSLTAIDTQVTVGKKVDVDVLGQKIQAWEIKDVSESIAGGLSMTSYVNDEMDILRSSMPMAGLKVEVVAATRAIALARPEVFEAFDSLAVASPSPLPITKETPSATYVLQAEKDQKLSLVESDYQSVRYDEAAGVSTVTVRNAKPEGDYYLPYQEQDAEALKAMGPSRYLQSDDETVRQLAEQAVGETALASEAAAKLEAFVAQYITKKDLSVGYASAADVARGREGDCTEHAVLLAAMCRAVGLPARVSCGVVYVPTWQQKKDVFLPHAWVEAYIGKEWVCLDAALHGFDVGHIAFCHGDGNPESFFGIINTLGNFKIVSASVEKTASSEPAQ